MYGCESWTVKKAEHWRIDAFELCCWRRLLRVPWTAQRSNQSILKEISSGCSLERLMLKLKLQSIPWPPDAKNWLIGKDPDAGKDWGWEEKGTTEDEVIEWYHWQNGHAFGWTLGVGDGQGSWCAEVHGAQRIRHDWATALNWMCAKVFVAQSCLTLCDPMEPTRFLCPWNSPDKNTGVGSHSLLQGIFPTQGSNSGLLLHCRKIPYHLSYQGSPVR